MPVNVMWSVGPDKLAALEARGWVGDDRVVAAAASRPDAVQRLTALRCRPAPSGEGVRPRVDSPQVWRRGWRRVMLMFAWRAIAP